jgi:putative protease
VLIPAATFKEIRSRLYARLSEMVSLDGFREGIAAARAVALREVSKPREESQRTPGGRESLAVIMENPRDWRFPLQTGADCTVLSLSKATIHQLPSVVPRMRGSEERIVWQIPFIIFERDMPLYRDTLRQLHGAGFRRFEASNISHFTLLGKLEGLHVSAGQRCFSLNSQALLAWQELGAESATLYIEDDAPNLTELLGATLAIERRLTVYAPLPVMTTKIRIKDVHSNTPLQSDRGEEYHVASRDGLQTIYAAVPFSLTARHNELRRKGCCSFLIDLRQERREAWGEIISAFKAGREIPGTTEFNYATELV